MRHRPFVSKKYQKQSAGRCAICGESDPKLLDLHRIVHGEDGGRYEADNVACLCVKHHRLHHAGRIEILGWYNSTAGKVLRWVNEEGEETFTPY